MHCGAVKAKHYMCLISLLHMEFGTLADNQQQSALSSGASAVCVCVVTALSCYFLCFSAQAGVAA